ncbi:hypothetical protein AXF42_Ash020469 [Apostasia shenzhenica]|uniref:Retrotransposon gag domain-containing protein n=1 Tax=Apostasia shenzhenica TaxID=1088818 RepID=A0A2H9ZZ85_9ASPA|nr:hypothetical protein AXF42_Ash020469 [Apostasia shenzhenica]
MNSFLTNLPVLLHQRPPLPLAPTPPPEDPVPPPSTVHNEPPPEEVSTHAVGESRLEVYPSVPQVTTIFSPTVMAAPVPRNYKAPKVNDYNVLTDPAQHVKRFENTLATGDPISDAYKCRHFRNTLTGLALDWLYEIPQGSIQSFEQFADQFRTAFGTSKTTFRTIHELWQIRQCPNESLQEYMSRLSKMNAEMTGTTNDRSTMIFVHSILPRKLYDSFVDDMPKKLMEAWSPAEKMHPHRWRESVESKYRERPYHA